MSIPRLTGKPLSEVTLPVDIPENQRRFLLPIKTNLDELSGKTGDGLNRAVTLADLASMGFPVTKGPNGKYAIDYSQAAKLLNRQ